MRVYTYSQARQKLAEVLDFARREEVRIKRRTGDSYSIRYRSDNESPFDIKPIKTKASTKDILEAVASSRAR
jgi:PHD/YefM family antitoxin component YafN of YafNO toxin-antitoxin module